MFSRWVTSVPVILFPDGASYTNDLSDICDSIFTLRYIFYLLCLKIRTKVRINKKYIGKIELTKPVAGGGI